MRRAFVAGGIAALVSAIPSTIWAIATRRDPLEPTLAAGSLLLPAETRRGQLLAAAVPVHLTLSFGWALVLERLVPRGGVLAGATAGLGIAALDLGLIGRRFERIRALPLVPQVADHVAYGATVGFVLKQG